MNWSILIRQAHRWMGVALVALTIINVIAFSLGYAIAWLYYLPLPPLFFLMLSGLYMFALPYLARRHGARTGGQA